jgi:hypothetical protein
MKFSERQSHSRRDRLSQLLVPIHDDMGGVDQPRLGHLGGHTPSRMRAGLIRGGSKETAAGPPHKRIVPPVRKTMSDRIAFAPAPSGATGSAFRRNIQRFAPRPASIGIPIPRRNAQRPYSLIRPHHICSEPRHLCRLIRVLHIAIPAFWSPKLSGTPGVASGFENILFLNGSIPCPQTPCRLSRLFQESLQCQPRCTGKGLRQGMEGGPTIACGPVPVVEEPEGIGNEFERR